ncbi:MAG: hypothetical protein A2044_07955 [Candidatus Firestonebacteria bacterium GWA2_43_8]|nr:MAG: hypothetical protein A2044_07955 [Candidatus Firestonebacteria bacterium GWA2_43_8]
MKEEHPIVRETIRSMVFFARGEKVMLDSDIAQLYGVDTRVVNQAVQRSLTKFPDNYMFQLTHIEYDHLRSQVVIANALNKSRVLPYVFTKRGIVMLATVLRSERAVTMAFEIVEVFVAVDEYLSTHKDLAKKISQIEYKLGAHSEIIKDILEQIRRAPEAPRRDKIY